jgi:hypothetical protein
MVYCPNDNRKPHAIIRCSEDNIDGRAAKVDETILERYVSCVLSSWMWYLRMSCPRSKVAPGWLHSQRKCQRH